ncbi:MAG TPA: addiction module protein [Thermoanaerobaculia bacterium]|nr:addiction module protein [Thermoanaerobaculia bacterium]
MEPLPKDLETAALRLEPTRRARLALRLIESLDAAAREKLDEEEIERLWLREAQERMRQIDAGEVELIPADEVLYRQRVS